MVILYKAIKSDLMMPNGKTGSDFKDKAQVSAWASQAVQALTAAGVISGYPDGTMKPKANISRGEVAAIIARYIK
ncbi:Cellulosome-anchoring protein precursor [compost metagenome]